MVIPQSQVTITVGAVPLSDQVRLNLFTAHTYTAPSQPTVVAIQDQMPGHQLLESRHKPFRKGTTIISETYPPVIEF